MLPLASSDHFTVQKLGCDRALVTPVGQPWEQKDDGSRRDGEEPIGPFPSRYRGCGQKHEIRHAAPTETSENRGHHRQILRSRSATVTANLASSGSVTAEPRRTTREMRARAVLSSDSSQRARQSGYQ